MSRTNQIARIFSDFKLDVINSLTFSKLGQILSQFDDMEMNFLVPTTRSLTFYVGFAGTFSLSTGL